MTTDPSTPSAALSALAGRLRPGAGVRQRQAVLPEPLRGFHRRLLRAFVTETGPPDADVVGRLVAELGLDSQAAVAAVAGIDLVHSDSATGAVSVAYPFSGRPTPYRGGAGRRSGRVRHVCHRRPRHPADAGPRRPHQLQ
jgi:hypothetical protein